MKETMQLVETTIQLPEKFKYRAELEELTNIPGITASIESITNQEFIGIIQPFYEWAIKLRAMSKLNFSALITNKYNTIIIELFNKEKVLQDITIPPNINHIIIKGNSKFRITLPNQNSLLINNHTYRDIVQLLQYKKVIRNIEIYHTIEKIGLTLLKEVVNKVKNKTLKMGTELHNTLVDLHLNSLRVVYEMHITTIINNEFYLPFKNTLYNEIKDTEQLSIYPAYSKKVKYHLDNILEVFEDYSEEINRNTNKTFNNTNKNQ